MAWLSEAVITTIQQIMNAVMPFRFLLSHVFGYVVSSETHQEINTGRNSLKTGDVTANYRDVTANRGDRVVRSSWPS